MMIAAAGVAGVVGAVTSGHSTGSTAALSTWRRPRGRARCGYGCAWTVD